MKLYIYHHCPFCVRADMVANYKDVEHEKIFLLNDDEETCYRLINAKQVPILEMDDGSAMAESLDIAHWLDKHGNAQKMIRPATGSDAFTAAYSAAGHAISGLLFPRNLALGLPEFMTDSARLYFRQKKENIIGQSFAQAMAQTEQYRTQVDAMLAALPQPEMPAAHHNTISWDDLLIYPTLRNLTMVSGLNFPPQILDYLHQISQLTGTQLYLEQAL